jgi:hypothetical protein
MQNRRKDKTLRNKERANERCAKRLARGDENFRKKERARELDVKRSARGDENFRKKERARELDVTKKRYWKNLKLGFQIYMHTSVKSIHVINKIVYVIESYQYRSTFWT